MHLKVLLLLLKMSLAIVVILLCSSIMAPRLAMAEMNLGSVRNSTDKATLAVETTPESTSLVRAYGSYVASAPRSMYNYVSSYFGRSSSTSTTTMKRNGQSSLLVRRQLSNTITTLLQHPDNCGREGPWEESGKINRRRVARMVQGVITGPKQFPWHAVVVRYDSDGKGEYVCGATAVGEQWVVTAAQCLHRKQLQQSLLQQELVEPKELGVIFNMVISLPLKQELEIGVDKIITHPKYNLNGGNADIALLKLRSPISAHPNYNSTLSEIWNPICLPESDSQIGSPAMSLCGTVGFGRNESVLGAQMRISQAQISPSQDFCFQHLNLSRSLSKICTEMQDAALQSTDYGGSLMCEDLDQKKHHLYGVASKSSFTTRPNLPSLAVFEDVRRYTKWVRWQAERDCGTELKRIQPDQCSQSRDISEGLYAWHSVIFKKVVDDEDGKQSLQPHCEAVFVDNRTLMTASVCFEQQQFSPEEFLIAYNVAEGVDMAVNVSLENLQITQNGDLTEITVSQPIPDQSSYQVGRWNSICLESSITEATEHCRVLSLRSEFNDRPVLRWARFKLKLYDEQSEQCLPANNATNVANATKFCVETDVDFQLRLGAPLQCQKETTTTTTNKTKAGKESEEDETEGSWFLKALVTSNTAGLDRKTIIASRVFA